jgi:hypothetical protein
VKADVSIEEQAEDIAPSHAPAKPQRSADPRRRRIETGMFEVPAGGRR